MARNDRDIEEIIRPRDADRRANEAAQRSAAHDSYVQPRRRLMRQILDAALAAAAAIKTMPEDQWPPAEILNVLRERRGLFGPKSTRVQTSAFKLATYRYIGPEQTWATPEFSRWTIIVYLLADGTLCMADRPIDERLAELIVESGPVSRGGWDADKANPHSPYAAIRLEDLLACLQRLAQGST